MVPVNSSHVELGHPMPRYRLSFNGILLYGFKIAYTPNPENRKLYDELFKEFLNIYKCNKGIYNRLNRFET